MPQTRRYVLKNSLDEVIFAASRPSQIRRWFAAKNLRPGSYTLEQEIKRIDFNKRGESDFKSETLIKT